MTGDTLLEFACPPQSEAKSCAIKLLAMAKVAEIDSAIQSAKAGLEEENLRFKSPLFHRRQIELECIERLRTRSFEVFSSRGTLTENLLAVAGPEEYNKIQRLKLPVQLFEKLRTEEIANSYLRFENATLKELTQGRRGTDYWDYLLSALFKRERLHQDMNTTLVFGGLSRSKNYLIAKVSQFYEPKKSEIKNCEQNQNEAVIHDLKKVYFDNYIEKLLLQSVIEGCG